jgi:myo-inositol-1(or 4)-monophosphatase
MPTSLDFAIQLARRAGKLLAEQYQSAGITTNIKVDRSVVTNADIAADQLIAAAIRESYPDDLLMSEELNPTFPAETEPGPARSAWIVDPLDGTTNFSLGLHIWGTLLAHLKDGQPDTAVMYFPLLDEIYYAQRGEGAYLNGKRIQVHPPDDNHPFTFFACCSRTFRRYQVSVPYKIRILGSTGYSLSTVARGMSILGFEASPKIWDIAAAWLLVKEAGGVIETLDGSQPFPLQPGIDYARRSFPSLAAPTPELAARARQQIVPK